MESWRKGAWSRPVSKYTVRVERAIMDGQWKGEIRWIKRAVTIGRSIAVVIGQR